MASKKKEDNSEVTILKDYSKFWSKMAYKIDAYTFSLDDMEHGVLRSNRIHPSSNKRFFDDSDARIKFVVNKFTPLIHFALNCGAKVNIFFFFFDWIFFWIDSIYLILERVVHPSRSTCPKRFTRDFWRPREASYRTRSRSISRASKYRVCSCGTRTISFAISI